jgi:glyoxylase-like metal-dependent hydrolase (beta-lactamase superfamily II)
MSASYVPDNVTIPGFKAGLEWPRIILGIRHRGESPAWPTPTARSLAAELEVAPGIHRIESVLGPRPFSQYLVRGERSLLVDTGVAQTPEAVILPYLEGMGLGPDDLDFVLNTHADVDHFGGNAAIRSRAPRAVVCAHVADVSWIEDRERILRERYGWYAAHDVDYSPEEKDWLRQAMGPDVPVDLRLSGGESLRLGPELVLQVIHLPGHSPGHLGLWEPTSRTAIITDAALGRGLYDMAGDVISPPPYFDVAAYEGSVRLLKSLAPQRLLTAHYEVMEGDEVTRFLEESANFVDRTRLAVAEALANHGELTLRGLLETSNRELGPFTAMQNELAGTLRAHAQELVASGRAEEVSGKEPAAWISCAPL